jgi:carbon starvation protein CstA
MVCKLSRQCAALRRLGWFLYQGVVDPSRWHTLCRSFLISKSAAVSNALCLCTTVLIKCRRLAGLITVAPLLHVPRDILGGYLKILPDAVGF